MRLFEREAYIIREAAYFSFLEYKQLWREVAEEYMDSDLDVDCPTATRAFNRAKNQLDLANFLDPQSACSFYTFYTKEKTPNERD